MPYFTDTTLLGFIDNWTLLSIVLINILILMFAMIYGSLKFFAWFLIEIADLRKRKKKKYDDN